MAVKISKRDGETQEKQPTGSSVTTLGEKSKSLWEDGRGEKPVSLDVRAAVEGRYEAPAKIRAIRSGTTEGNSGSNHGKRKRGISFKSAGVRKD